MYQHSYFTQQLLRLVVLWATVFLAPLFLFSQQKKPLTHEVYDDWKALAEKKISNDGRYIAYTINPQQGDGTLYLQSLTDTASKFVVERGYGIEFSQDNQFLIAKIKPRYQEQRQARIKKKKPDEMPRDSLIIIRLANWELEKSPKLKSYKLPEKSGTWLAYHVDTNSVKVAKKPIVKDTLQDLVRLTDSIIKKSLQDVKGKVPKEKVIEAAQKAAKEIYKSAKKDSPRFEDADEDEKPGAARAAGSDLVLKPLSGKGSKTFHFVSDYHFDKYGNTLLLKTTKNTKDSLSKTYVILHHLAKNQSDTLMSAFNDAKNFTSDETGKQWAFVAERDSVEKALQKFYKLWYYTAGTDSARNIVNRSTNGVRNQYTISDNATIRFSKDGKRLFFGVAPVQPPKDTTLVDFETARLDIWHYQDDYIQPQQLKQLPQESKRSYLAVVNPEKPGVVIQLGDRDAETVSLVNEGNASWVLAQSTSGHRIAANWEGRPRTTAYVINLNDGTRKLVQQNQNSFFQASPAGNYIIWYNPEKKHYFSYKVATGQITNISKGITDSLFDITSDVPDFPRPMGVAGWLADDSAVLINGYFDIWKLAPDGKSNPVSITLSGKTQNKDWNLVTLDSEKKYFEQSDTLLLTAQNRSDKSWNLFLKPLNSKEKPQSMVHENKSYTSIAKAKDARKFLIQKSNIAASELYFGSNLAALTQLTDIAQQQEPYIWLTAELLHWKMFDGKTSEGILYKPENFDPKKKYPVLFYFYEKNSDGLYSYKPPAPSASIINIPYFVSNGYIVFDPNIYYKTGQPGESAYNSVVSAAKHLSKFPWVDSTRMGIQGQSWGGYQVAYLVTRTNIFRAAGAGAPVSNMTSAYGGIRWSTGMVRQFQYEKQQSRIGATLWQRPDLYLKNSPLFTANKINTPLLIMHNDADGAVPWYQGIELFSAMRRLGKKVWLLQYNGEDHNLVERRNRKDLSVRLSQFFDYYLKGAKPANWILHGVPAVDKGRTWGLEIPEP